MNCSHFAGYSPSFLQLLHMKVSVVYVPERGHDHQVAILALSTLVTSLLFNHWSSTRLDEWLKYESVLVRCDAQLVTEMWWVSGVAHVQGTLYWVGIWCSLHSGYRVLGGYVVWLTFRVPCVEWYLV